MFACLAKQIKLFSHWMTENKNNCNNKIKAWWFYAPAVTPPHQCYGVMPHLNLQKLLVTVQSFNAAFQQ